ncbi:hypothetical protein [Laspinema olomoucense]|uniref:Uncharacterized protein n=1 Tax=Laspinema olomoucense D3b TaxID=2953688 RepID=A0ABT2NI60_9CYAN|nr:MULTISPECIES: hypothetical protein [unclassified Laspinema]MCT7975590.1 hypothetical protein [Laspinema sp. D3d]MCT7980976.1 hypothetical protein [Laspinema sp. D3b]MCT7991549.1 hypothetical protein [Laspinema sp. D3a]
MKEPLRSPGGETGSKVATTRPVAPGGGFEGKGNHGGLFKRRSPDFLIMSALSHPYPIWLIGVLGTIHSSENPHSP